MADERPQIRRSEAPAVILHPAADIHTFEVTEETLDQLADSGLSKSLNVVFASALFGALISLIVWLSTGDFTGSISKGTIVIATIGAGVLFANSSLRGFFDYRRSKQLLARVKSHHSTHSYSLPIGARGTPETMRRIEAILRSLPKLPD